MSTTVTLPKIELHVHLEGAVRPRLLLEIAHRNGVRLPVDTESELAALYRFRDFSHFLELWLMTTCAIRTPTDFRQIVTAYAEEAASKGAVYLEAIFTPAERVEGGASYDEVFAGFCDGAAEARERFDIEVRLTPDIPRSFGTECAETTVDYALKYADRGIVGVGLGGPEVGLPAARFTPAFSRARDGGLGSVPHAGEVTGPASVREAIEVLGARRIRHGIGAAADPTLLAELAERGIVCDVCLSSNLATGAVEDLARHPLAAMASAGVACSVNTDDPAMFGTDLDRETALACGLGYSAKSAYEAGIAGALCDETTRARLSEIGAAADWAQDEAR